MSDLAAYKVITSRTVPRDGAYMIEARTIVLHTYTGLIIANPILVALDLIMADLVALAHRKLDAATPKQGDGQ